MDKKRKKRYNHYSNMDGEVISTEILSGMSDMRQNHIDNTNFYPFDGIKVTSVNNVSPDTTTSQDGEEMSYAGGFFGAWADSIRAKGEAEKIKAQAMSDAAKASLAPDTTSLDLVKELNKGNKTTETAPKTMSLGAKIGIGVLVAGFIGTTIYLIVRKKKK